jgi:hydrogenase maturation protein HypF
MRSFYVLGRDRIGREPWISAAALMWEAARDWMPGVSDASLALQAWRKRIGTARTSSVGRLFDAAASLVLGIESASYEGQGPMMLESIARKDTEAVELPLVPDAYGVLRTDWAPLLPVLRDDARSQEERAGIFHESLALAAVKQVVAVTKRDRFDVGLTGGVFQNRILAERIAQLLSDLGVRTYLPQIVPANDGGIAFGQLIEVLGIDCSSRAFTGGRVS